MKIEILAIGDKMPNWIKTGFDEYAHRLPVDSALHLKQIKAASRGKNPDIRSIILEEERRLMAAIPKSAHRVALDVKGKQWATPELAEQLNDWRQLGKPLAIIIGGADGLSTAMLNQSEQRWSLSHLTLPHYLVRIILAEQLYRAWTILNNHPYHRG